jgi:hypothetical protein
VLYRDEIQAAHERIERLERELDILGRNNAALRAWMRKRTRWQVAWLTSGVALGALLVAVAVAVAMARPRSLRTATPVEHAVPPPTVVPPPAVSPPPTWRPIPGFEGVTAAALSDGASYAVGPGGAIWRHGSKPELPWTREESGTSQDLLSVVRLSNGAVAVGRGGTAVVLDRGGTRWVSATEAHVPYVATWHGRSDLFAIRWVGDETSGFFYAVGAKGTTLRMLALDDAFEQEPSPTRSDLFDVCGDGNVNYAVGEGGTILRWAGRNAFRLDDAAKWTVEASPTKSNLYGVWCDKDDAYAVGAGGVILHKRDQREPWTIEPSGTSADLRAIRVTAGQSEGTRGAAREPRHVLLGGDGPTLLENRDGGWVSANTSGLEGDVRSLDARSLPSGMVLTSRGLFSLGDEPNVPPLQPRR